MASHDVPRASRPRSEEERQQELERISKYRSLEDEFRQQMSLAQLGVETLQLTTKLLRLNPEYYTVWNVRRRCLLSGPLDEAPAEPLSPERQASHHSVQEVIRSELSFIVPLLMQHPKCYWIWNQRTWILQQAIDKLAVAAARALWEEELALVGKMLHRDRRNYHAWAYRRHVVGRLESAALQGTSMVEEEFQYTTKMIRVDLSNFSAWHNRSQLICRLLDERSSSDAVRKQFLDDELELVRNGLNVGPEDQSLWYYHNFLMSNVTGQRDGRIAPRLTMEERTAYISREIDEIKDLLEDYDDVKWIYQALVEYAVAARQLGGGDEQVGHWLAKLRTLDPLRKGRWDDLAHELGLA